MRKKNFFIYLPPFQKGDNDESPESDFFDSLRHSLKLSLALKVPLLVVAWPDAPSDCLGNIATLAGSYIEEILGDSADNSSAIDRRRRRLLVVAPAGREQRQLNGDENKAEWFKVNHNNQYF